MSRDFVLLKIDTERHLNGEAVAKKLRGERTGGIPWMVITDAEGAELIASDAPDGNIGCPASEGERAWFMKMIRETRQHMGDDAVSAIEKALADNAKKLGY